MSMNETDIRAIVRRVLENMADTGAADIDSKPNGACKGQCSGDCNCKKPKAAVLTGKMKLEVKSFPMPVPDDDEILVRVEGCGICGTDVHEWKSDPFGLIPVILGHEGTGEIVALGKNVAADTAGTPVRVGDKVVSSVMVCGRCKMCRLHPDKPNLCENAGIYGLFPESQTKPLNGWFANYILLRKGSTFFNVTGMSLDQRMLVELAAVCVHAAGRAGSVGILDFNSKIVVQGCGPVGLMLIAVLKTYGYSHIIAIDGDVQRLEMAKEMGATSIINFREQTNLEERVRSVKAQSHELGADFAFQCTGVPAAAADVWKYVRVGGGLCEMGFFVNNGECSINPHFDICQKEITVVGSWTYSHLEYPVTIAFVKRAKEIGIPLEKLITHRYGLDELNEAMETNVAQKGIKIAFVN